jgi:iron complex outermembrane receptor protein
VKIYAVAIFFLSEIRGLKRLGALDPSHLAFRSPLFGLCAALLLCAGYVSAAEPVRHFDVPAGNAVDTLKLAAQQGDVEIAFFAETVRGVQTPELHGDFAAREALRRLIAGTGLVISCRSHDSTVIVRRGADCKHDTSPTSSTSPTDTPTVKSSTTLWTLSAWLAFAFSSSNSVAADAKDDAIKLTPFEVSTNKDRGYAAGNTLSGGRVDTPLVLTPGSI